MPLTNLFKLQKLRINVYSDERRAGRPQQVVEVMFNPTSLSVSHANKYSPLQGINTSGRRARYSHTMSSEISLDLVLDGTGVTEMGITSLIGMGWPSVAKQVEALLQACFYMDGNIHEPRFLKLEWGNGELKDFPCRTQSVDITYTLFDRDGSPLRATLKTVFVEDPKPVQKSSPDLTHTRVVKSGDTLPLLAKEIYGSASYYLQLAQANNLDNFRDLIPGQTIIFPPLDKSA